MLENFESILNITTDIRLAFGIINGLVILGTLIGSSFFLYLFYQERNHRKIAHNYVISMCFGDIFHVGLGCSIVIEFCTGLQLSDDFCPVASCLLMISVYVSLFTLTSAAVDRYMAVCHPVKYQSNMTHNKSYGIIVLGWILAILAGIPLYFMRSNKYKQYPDAFCLYLSWVYDLEYLFGYLMLIMNICVIIIVILYIKIYIAIRKVFHSKFGDTAGLCSIITWIRDQNNQENPETAAIGLLKVREVKVTCIMFATVVSFVLCWTPCIIVVLSNNVQPNKVTSEILIAYIFPKFYSMINPIFYAYAIKNVRKAFKRNLSKILGRKESHETEKKEKSTQITT